MTTVDVVPAEVDSTVVPPLLVVQGLRKRFIGRRTSGVMAVIRKGDNCHGP